MRVAGKVVALPVMDRRDPGIAARYEADGVVTVRDVLSPHEIADLTTNVERYRKWMLGAVPSAWVRREEDGTVRGMYYMDRVDPYFKTLGERADLFELVEQVTGGGVEFAAVETFDKPARVGGPSLPHQDGIYFKGTSTRLVHIWIPLESSTRENGAVLYWTGTQQNGLAEHVATDDPHLLAIPDHVIDVLPAPHVAELEPGSVALHCDAVIHASPPNRSERSRRAVLVAFTLT